MKNFFLIGLIAFFSTMTAVKVFATGDPARGKARYAVCQACHGANGMGNKALNSPKIAGQEPWYLERQLKNFKAGIRGANPNDKYGMQMRPMALTLSDEQSVRDMSAYVSSMPVKRNIVKTIKGDLEEGKAIYVVCQACHGLTGEGNKTLNSPRLAGLQDWYLVRQLKNFKSGIRGKKRDDIFGMQMRPMAMSLENDEAINNVAAYIASFN